MSTVHTTSVSPDARQHDARSFPFALAALMVTLLAATAVSVVTWQPWAAHRAPALTRVVGPDTFVASVYDEQVPAAAAPLTDGTVFRQQVPTAPAALPDGNVFREQVPAAARDDAGNGVKGLDDDSARLSRDGNVFREQVPAAARDDAGNGVKGLDDDSARLSRDGNAANGVKGLDDDSAALPKGSG